MYEPNPDFIVISADTLYMCYCIDKGMGEQRREEVFVVVSSSGWYYFQD